MITRAIPVNWGLNTTLLPYCLPYNRGSRSLPPPSPTSDWKDDLSKNIREGTDRKRLSFSESLFLLCFSFVFV